MGEVPLSKLAELYSTVKQILYLTKKSLALIGKNDVSIENLASDLVASIITEFANEYGMDFEELNIDPDTCDIAINFKEA